MSKDKKTGEHQSKDGEQQLKELEAKCQEYLSGWQRAQADYQNLKKETEQKISSLKEFIAVDLIIQLLPIYGHYKTAVSHIPQELAQSDWAIGFKHIQNNFSDFFKQYQIEEINVAGEQFNPEFHEAISYQESEIPEDQIIKEISPGYKMNGMVIRPAQVIVSKSIKSINQENN